MGSLGEVAATSAKGSFTLFVGNSVALLVNAAGSILVARMLSPSEYGLFSVSLVIPGLFMLFSDWGVNSALVQFIARSRSQDKLGRIRGYQRTGFIFKLMVGGVLSLILWIFSDVLATVLLRRPEAGQLVRVASLLVLFQPMHNIAVAMLAGLERMDYRAAVNVSQSLVKGICSPLLVYYGFGVSGALIGHVSSFVMAACVGYLLTVSSSRWRERIEKPAGFFNNLKIMLAYGLPLFLGTFVAGFTGSLRGFLMPWFVSDEVIGNYGVALQFMSLIGLVTGSIGVTLFPTFSKLSYTMEPEKTREIYQGSVRYSSMFVLPLAFLLAAISEPLVYTLYTSKYPLAPSFFLLLLIPIMLVGTGSLSIGNFLNSQGDTGTTMKIGLIGSAVSILLSPVLIWIWGMPGLIVSIIVSSVIANILGVYVLYRKYDVIPDLGHMGKMLLCSGISAGSAYGVLWLLSTITPLQSLFIGSTIFLIVFLVLAPVTGALEEQDIVNLDSMMRDIRFVYPFIRLILVFEEKIIKFARAV